MTSALGQLFRCWATGVGRSRIKPCLGSFGGNDTSLGYAGESDRTFRSLYALGEFDSIHFEALESVKDQV